MKRKFAYLFYLVLLMTSAVAHGQNTITGTLQGEDAEPLLFATVAAADGSTTVLTDDTGAFTIDVEETTEALIFSYIGYVTKTVLISNTTNWDVTLELDENALQEVVVTALGIEKPKESLGYATQKVDGKKLEETPSPNVFSSLTGNIAGLQVNNTTDFFQDPGLSLRGRKPLIVIDGIPDRTADLWKVKSEDIESVDVLKGLTASALYGADGRNGAIMITTKKGKSDKVTITFDNTTTFQTGFIRIPDVQTVYGNGNRGNYAYNNGSGSGSEGGGWIWGPKLDQRDPSTASGFVEVPQYNSPIDEETGELIPIPFISRGANNIENFFRTGVINSSSLGFQWGNDIANVRVSGVYQKQKGIMPNTELTNPSVSFAGGLNLGDRLELQTNFNYNSQFTDNFPEIGYGPTNYLYNLVLWTGADVDVRDLENYWAPNQEGYQQRHFNISYYNNPHFQVNEYQKGYYKDNLFGNFSAKFHLNDFIDLKARTGINQYSLLRTYKEPKSYIGYGVNSNGNYEERNTSYFDINTDFGLSLQKMIHPKISLRSELGYYNYKSNNKYSSIATDGLNIPNFYNFANNAGSTFFAKNRKIEEASESVYAFADLGYDDTYYLSITGRNDWVSTLPVDNNSFFYPSVSGSVVLSNLMSLPEQVNFLKLRGSWAQVSNGRFGRTYSQIAAFNNDVIWNGQSTVSTPTNIIPPGLKPESTRGWEIGTDIGLFDNQLNLGFTYYNEHDEDLIINKTISDASGYRSILLNGGADRRNGMELVASTNLELSPKLNWSSSLNLSRNREYVDEIADGDEYRNNYLQVDDRTDLIRIRRAYEKTPDGRTILNDSGYPVRSPSYTFVGYSTPDLVYGFSNNFTLNKSLNFNFQVDGRVGGEMFSQTNQKMWWGGKHPGTVNSYRDDANEGIESYIENGVIVTGGEVVYSPVGEIISDTRTYRENDVAVNYASFMKSTSNYHNHNQHYYSQTFLKLRNAGISYSFPTSLISKAKLTDLRFGVVGTNLFVISDLPNVDPDSGRDSLQAPSTRNIGITLNAKF